MTTEAFGSVPHSTPPASNRGALSYGGESSPDELLEGIKRIRKRKQAALSIKFPVGRAWVQVEQSAKEKIASHIRLTILLGTVPP